ncbi:NADAR domain-containing protein (plasmid) [Clostridium perfringens]
MIRIVNLRNYKANPNEILIKIDRSNIALGNKFKMKSESDRDLVCNEYAKWFETQIKSSNSLVLNELRRIYKLALKKDIALGCWCYPKRCHGETIKKFLDMYLTAPKKNKLTTLKGNLLDIKQGVILHQVNNCGKFGKGLALAIKKKYPKHFKDYLTAYNLAHTNHNSIKKTSLLGTTVKTELNNLIIYGLFSQDGYGTDRRYTSYKHLKECLNIINKQNHTTIYIPYKLGCGLAGGDWDVVKEIILQELPNAIILRPTISSFRGEYFFLSNFYKSPVNYDGITYQNNEAAFQAAKFTNNDSLKLEFAKLEPNVAKSRGRSVPLRKDWECVKENIMFEICLAKFSQNPYLKKKLLSTGDLYLEEGNSHGDDEWGTVNGLGQNKLGIILMKVRDCLKK